MAERRKNALRKWWPPLTASLIINGILLIWLASYVLSQPAVPVANFSVSAPLPDAPDEVKNQTLERKRKQHQSRPSAAAFTAVVVPNINQVVFDSPQFERSEMTDLSLVSGLDSGLGYASSGAGTSQATDSGTIGGMNVRSRRLGVILDVSGSMGDQIKAVRKELRKNFARAVIIEVGGCRLDFEANKEVFDPSKSTIELEKVAKSVVEGVEMLVVRHRADAIYWFSDLNDARTKAGLDRLSQLLGTHFGSERLPIKFYVQSVDEAPDAKLESIATRSGGAIKVKAYRIDNK